MKKKVLYGIFFISIFLLSTASMVQPSRGYEWGIPKEVVGVTGEGEVKIFDEDEFEKSFGKGADPEDFIAGDSDVVGAKSKSTYTEIETDEDLIKYEEVYVYKAAGFDDAYPSIQGAPRAAAIFGASTEVPPITYLINATSAGVGAAFTGVPVWYGDAEAIATGMAGAADAAELLSLISVMDYDDAMDIYGDKYDGSLLTRDKWDFTDEAFKSKPDERDDEVPFLADPRDWYASYRNTRAFGNYIVVTMQGILSQLDTWLNTVSGNTTIYAILDGEIQTAVAGNAELDGTIASLGSGDYVLGSYILNYVLLGRVIAEVTALVPDKFGYLWQLLWAGQPVYTPQADFIERMLKEFDIDDEVLYGIPFCQYGKDILDATGQPGQDGSVSAIPFGKTITSPIIGAIPLPGETIYAFAYADVENEDGTLTIEIEWPDDWIDPEDYAIFGGDNEEELSDFEVVFPYGDTGTQGDVTCKDGDEIFWQTGGVDQIPGFEVTIILGASAIAILGMIFVVMKKRKM